MLGLGRFIVAISVLVTASAGGEVGEGDRVPIAIRFAPVADGAPVSCSTPLEGVGITESEARIADFRLYVSEAGLIRRDGSVVPIELDAGLPWNQASVTLLDFEDGTGSCRNGTPQTNREVVGVVPEGDYVGLEFVVGVPFELNHRNPVTAGSPLDVSAMFWTWNSGYKFLRLDMTTTGQPQGYAVHLGSTGCTPSDAANVAPTNCRNPNRASVRISDFDVETDEVILDVAALLAAANVDLPGQHFGGCMSGEGNPACTPIFNALGLNEASQSVFRSSRGGQ